MSVKDLLIEEIERLIGSMEDIPMCSPEYKQAAEDLAKMLDRLNEMDRIENEHLDKNLTREIETQLKVEQMSDERKDRIVKNVLTGVSVVGGFAITIWGTIKSIKFEETGTITTIMGRGFINKLLPKK